MCIVYTEIINSGWDWQVVRCGTCRGAKDGNEGGILTKEKKKGKEGDERRWFGIVCRLRGGGRRRKENEAMAWGGNATVDIEKAWWYGGRDMDAARAGKGKDAT